MNCIYRLVWGQELNAWDDVAKTVKGLEPWKLH